MALNDLLHHHQVSLMRADAAAGPAARRRQLDLALDYARRIEALVGPGRGRRAPLVPVA